MVSLGLQSRWDILQPKILGALHNRKLSYAELSPEETTVVLAAFACSIDQAMLVAIQNMLPFWFLVLSVVYFVISVLPIHVFLLVCWPGLFFAQYILVGVPCRVRSVSGLLSIQKLALFPLLQSPMANQRFCLPRNTR
ncbi:hypothetical protein VPH35_046419 [Triticum aestivum]